MSALLQVCLYVFQSKRLNNKQVMYDTLTMLMAQGLGPACQCTYTDGVHPVCSEGLPGGKRAVLKVSWTSFEPVVLQPQAEAERFSLAAGD